MRAFIPAIALCAGLHAAAAPQPLGQAASAMASPAQGVLHAQLVTPADGVPSVQRRTDAVKASLQPRGAAQADDAQEHHPTTAAMLLAALALMTGIAVRRWGAGQQ